MCAQITCSPTTRQFVEESLAKGLPLIPFNYSSADIVEKRRAERRNKVFFPVNSNNPYEGNEVYNSMGASSSPARTKYRKLNQYTAEEDNKEDKSLHGLLCRAKKEMEEESFRKKVNVP